jgi:hypothetical protein
MKKVSPEALAALNDIRVVIRDLLKSRACTVVDSDMDSDKFFAAAISAGLKLAVQFSKLRNSLTTNAF